MGDVFAERYELVDALSGDPQGPWRVWDRQDRVYRAGQLVEGEDAELNELIGRLPGRGAHLAAPAASCAENGRTLVVGPLHPGQLLAERLADREAIDLDNALQITDELLVALGALHEAGLVHRTVSDQVVILRAGRRPRVLLGGFGTLAEASGPEDRGAGLGGAVGTPGYMSFEAFSGAAPDPLQDLYSVGALLTQMLTGRRPSAGAVARGGIEVPAEYRGTPVGEFLAGLLADAGHRTPSAQAVRRELTAARAAVLKAHEDEGGSAPRMASPFIVEDCTPALPPSWGEAGPLPVRVSEHTVRLVQGSDGSRLLPPADDPVAARLAARRRKRAGGVLLGALLCVLVAVWRILVEDHLF